MDEKDLLTVLLSQSFSALNERIKMQNEKIEALEKKNTELSDELKNAWSVMKAMDERLSAAYAAAVNGNIERPVSLINYKFGDEEE